MNTIKKEQYEGLEKEMDQYIEQLERLDSLPVPVTIRMETNAQQLGFAPQEPFEIKVPLLLAILSGWKEFHAWLKKTYGDKDGTIDTSLGYKVGKFARIAINAMKYIVFGVIKRVNEIKE